ncbi:hypothetical protein [Fusobacterium sp. PH5-44]|uniref:hypothetical protein n=1 Tax=unclassified Fusobacterium TaxID=2648384 RepID=UPI003D246C8A
MISAIFNKNELIINETQKIIFKRNIKEIILDKDRVYVLVEIPWIKVDEETEDDYSNVYCYTEDGKILWQIEKREKPAKTFFIMIRIINNELRATDFIGIACILNKDTGKIMRREFMK